MKNGGNMDENTNVEEMFERFKLSVLSNTVVAVGTRMVKVGRKEGNTWWTFEVRGDLMSKRKAYKKI